MEYPYLGTTGTRVSELCFGTWRFGLESDGTVETTREVAHDLLDAAWDNGVTFIDTANVYGDPAGRSEQWIGEWLEDHDRDDLVLASKVYHTVGEGPNEGGLGRKHVRRAIEASLDRLGTDYLDVYYIHNWDENVPVETTLATMEDLVREGTVDHVGISNFAAWQLTKATYECDLHGWERPAVCQPRFNAADRSATDVLAACEDRELAVCPYSPLDGGFLTGKYDREDAPDDTRGDRHDDWLAGRDWDVLDAVTAVADEVGATPAQVALRWAMDHPRVTAPIVGARSVEQLREDLGALDVSLSDEQFDRIADAGSS
jgi:aryl-alcohol dehydrogenase-like predicted oxidoreductase